MSKYSTSIYAKTIYDAFNIKSKKNNIPIDFSKHSKQLILNTKSYISYSTYYGQLTTTNAYKLPDLHDYPIRKNKCLISLRKLENPMKWRKKMQQIPKEILTTNQTTEETKKEESIAFTEEILLYENGNPKHTRQANSSLNERSLLKCIDDFNNINILYKYISYKKKYSLPVHRGDFSYLAKHLEEQVWSNDMFDKASQLENEFGIMNNSYHVSIKCYSMTVVFHNEEDLTCNNNDDNKENKAINESIQEISFPFDLLPFFYGLTYANLKLFISLVISYDNGVFFINQTLFLQYYNKFKEDQQFYEDNSLFLSINKLKTPLQFDYPWITQTKSLDFTIKLPYYQFNLCSSSIQSSKCKQVSIEKPIDTRHIIHFLKNSFKDWDLFLLNSFSEYKTFRSTINQYLSFNPRKHIPSKVILGKRSIKSIEDLSDSKWEFFYTNEQNESFYMKLNSIKLQYYFPENDYRDFQNFKFDLTMHQTRQLICASHHLPMEELLKRCLNVKVIHKSAIEEVIKADLSLNYLNDLNEEFDANLMENYETHTKDKGYEINIIQPYIEWECYSMDHSQYKKIYIIPQVESMVLMKLPVCDWKTIIPNQLSIATKTAFSLGINDDLFAKNQKKFTIKRKRTSCNRLKSKLSSTLIIPKIEKKSQKILK